MQLGVLWMVMHIDRVIVSPAIRTQESPATELTVIRLQIQRIIVPVLQVFKIISIQMNHINMFIVLTSLLCNRLQWKNRASPGSSST